MNSKLIAMLIRSNALMIEALKMADANAQARHGGSYHFETDEFNNLVADCELMAKEAEAYTGDVEVQQVVSVAAAEGIQQGIEQLKKPFPPMVPISPAHQVEREKLVWGDVKVNRAFIGKTAHNNQPYVAVITETDVNLNSTDRAVNVRTKILKINGNDVAPFDRPIIAGQFKEEFERWIE